MLVKCNGKVIFRERIDPMNIQLKKGVMEIVVLSMLQRKDFYGYELVTEISKYIEMSEGTIYPLLNRFKKDGLVETYLAQEPAAFHVDLLAAHYRHDAGLLGAALLAQGEIL